MADEILSPPYPGEATTANVLHKYLGDLRVWVMTYRTEHNTAAGQTIVPVPAALPKKASYVIQPVLVHVRHLFIMKKLREEWDHMVRLYEDDWDDKQAVRLRLLQLQTAVTLIGDALVSSEVRELQGQDVLERMVRAFEGIDQTLGLKHEKKKR